MIKVLIKKAFKINKNMMKVIKRNERDSNPRVHSHTGFSGVIIAPSQRRTRLGNRCFFL